MTAPIMQEQTHTPDVSAVRNPEVAHEYSDVDVRAILRFGFYLAVGCGLVSLIVWGFYGYFEHRAERQELVRTPIERTTVSQLPPEPRLQLAPGHRIHPLDEMRQLREVQEARLSTSGTMLGDSSTHYVPLEIAKTKVLNAHLPSRQVDSLTAQREQGLLIGGQSSGGRMLEWRDH